MWHVHHHLLSTAAMTPMKFMLHYLRLYPRSWHATLSAMHLIHFFVHLHCRLIGMALCCLVMLLIPAVLMMTSRGLPACKGHSKPWRKMLRLQCPSLHTTKACLSHCSRALSLIKMAFRQCKNQQGDELCKHIECLKHISAQWFSMSLLVSSCWSRAVGRLLQSCCPFCVCCSLVYAVCHWLGVFMEHRVDRVGASLTTGAPSGMLCQSNVWHDSFDVSEQSMHVS